MSLDIPNGFAQVAYRWALVGDPEVMVSTMGYDFAAMQGSDQENLDALADQCAATYPAPGIAAGWTFLGCRAYVGIAGGDTVTVESPRSIIGTAPTATVTQNVCLLVKKRSAIPGRRGQGRMYIPPFMLEEGSVSAAGILTPTFVAQHQAGVNAWLGSNFAAYILHDTLPAPMPPTLITSLTLDRMVATQRRRLRR